MVLNVTADEVGPIKPEKSHSYFRVPLISLPQLRPGANVCLRLCVSEYLLQRFVLQLPERDRGLGLLQQQQPNPNSTMEAKGKIDDSWISGDQRTDL